MKAPHVLFNSTMLRAFLMDAFVNASKTSSEDVMPEAEMGVRRDMVSVARRFGQGQVIERDNSGQVQSTVSKTGQLVELLGRAKILIARKPAGARAGNNPGPLLGRSGCKSAEWHHDFGRCRKPAVLASNDNDSGRRGAAVRHYTSPVVS